MDGNLTGRWLLDSARRLSVDAALLRDAAEWLDVVGRDRSDPDSRRLAGELRDMGTRHGELASRLKWIGVQLQEPAERMRVRRIDEVLATYREERSATRRALGDGAD